MSGRDINHIIEIMKSDAKAAFSNPIVVIILIGVILLPSLYALLNIYACWDPYGNTGEIEFAIANLDKGASFDGQKINIGKELVKDLKENDKFKWTFVSEEELRTGVYNGTYYAGIVIPKNLTKNVVSITSDDPKQAELEYVVNVKTNPVAAKLTDSGSNAVYLSLNAKIVEIINLAAYEKLGELQSGLSAGAGKLSSGGYQLQAGSSKISAGASQVSAGASQVEGGASQVKSGVGEVQSGASAVNDGAESVKQGSAAVQQGASQVEQGSEELQAAVDPSLIPEGPVKDYVDGNVKLAEGSGEVAKGASELANGSVALAEGSLSLAAGSQLLSNAATQALFTASYALASSADKLGAITGINETILGEYFYSPVKLDRQEVFSVPNYGSDVSPFYIVLSMWVGAILTCVMLKTGHSTGTKYSPLEMYLGKLGLFVVVSILQACVTLIGCFLLGIYIVNPLLFIASGILVSMVFMILVYSLISAVGHVGKALAVVLLVLQISATGGIYPIEIMHGFFQALYKFMPMTYAIGLIREAQLGVVWSNYIPALSVLIGIGIGTVIVALIIKEKADKASHYVEKRMEESGLF